MTPIEIRKENARREREEERNQRKGLPKRQPAPTEHRTKLDEIRARCAAKSKP